MAVSSGSALYIGQSWAFLCMRALGLNDGLGSTVQIPPSLWAALTNEAEIDYVDCVIRKCHRQIAWNALPLWDNV